MLHEWLIGELSSPPQQSAGESHVCVVCFPNSDVYQRLIFYSLRQWFSNIVLYGSVQSREFAEMQIPRSSNWLGRSSFNMILMQVVHRICV